MTRRYKLIALLLLSSLMSGLAQAKSPVWRVSSETDVLYVGGTIHVLGQNDYPLPAAFDQAYALASTVVFETDLLKLQDPSFMAEMRPHLLYGDDQRIDQKLDQDTKEQLQHYLHSRGTALTALSQYKPGMLSLTMTMLELQRLGMAGAGVDQHFSALAERDNKRRGQLETAISQFEKIGRMGDLDESTFIQHTLHELEVLPELMQNLKDAWRQGDTDLLNQLALSSLSKDFPAIYESLLVDRNLAWLPHFIDMLANDDVELVLVGAAHLVGDDGLLNQLEALGYTIEQL